MQKEKAAYIATRRIILQMYADSGYPENTAQKGLTRLDSANQYGKHRNDGWITQGTDFKPDHLIEPQFGTETATEVASETAETNLGGEVTQEMGIGNQPRQATHSTTKEDSLQKTTVTGVNSKTKLNRTMAISSFQKKLYKTILTRTQ